MVLSSRDKSGTPEGADRSEPETGPERTAPGSQTATAAGDARDGLQEPVVLDAVIIDEVGPDGNPVGPAAGRTEPSADAAMQATGEDGTEPAAMPTANERLDAEGPGARPFEPDAALSASEAAAQPDADPGSAERTVAAGIDDDEPGADRPHAAGAADGAASAVSAQPGDAGSAGAASAASDGPGAAVATAPPAETAPPRAAPARSGGGFLPALLGGVLAAGAGFAVAEYDLLAAVTGAPEEDPVEVALEQQQERLAGLEDQIGQIAEAVASPRTAEIEGQIGALAQDLQDRLSDVAGRIDGAADRIAAVESELGQSLETVRSEVGSSLGGVNEALAGIDDRLTAVERRPLTESSETARQAFASYEEELEQLRGTLAEQREAAEAAAAQMEQRANAAAAKAEQVRSEAEARAAEAAERAARVEREATAREALARLDAAIERGDPFEAPLERLAGQTDIPEALSASAASGVTPLPELRALFPPLARAALDASIRETVEDDPVSRVGAFLRSQAGVRSLEPRDGDDPDAVLSRAEAALRANDLDTATEEIGALPEAGQSVLSDWVEQARMRADVTQAADDLRAALTGN